MVPQWALSASQRFRKHPNEKLRFVPRFQPALKLLHPGDDLKLLNFNFVFQDCPPKQSDAAFPQTKSCLSDLKIKCSGYPLDSGSPHRLWFGFGLRVNYPVMGNRIDGHSLLRQTKEELASTL